MSHSSAAGRRRE